MKTPMFKKPLGPSKLGNSFGLYWNNWMHESNGPVICEICGTEHPQREKTYIISRFLDYWVVEECCGAIIDKVYRESGEKFAIAFLEEFGKNPTSPRFQILLMTLDEVTHEAKQTALETAKLLHKVCIRLIPAINIVKERI